MWAFGSFLASAHGFQLVSFWFLLESVFWKLLWFPFIAWLRTRILQLFCTSEFLHIPEVLMICLCSYFHLGLFMPYSLLAIP